MNAIRILSMAAVLLAAGSARAGSVYLNGVQVDGLSNQKFTGATVTFDAQGNVHIDAPGIEVKTLGGTQGQPAQAQPAAYVTKHYFLVPQQAMTGMSGYDIDVFLNGTWVTRFKGAEDANPMDVTKYIKPGANKITFSARKGTERKSFSPQHTFSVLIGEGQAGADQVIIDNPIHSFTRNASQSDDATEEFSFNGR